MPAKKKAAAKRSTTTRTRARSSARGSVDKFLKQTGRSESDVVRFSDLRALEGYGGSDTASSSGDAPAGDATGDQG